MVPLGYIFPEDGICWGTQLAAELLPLPPSRGLAARMAGPHIYSGQVDVTSPGSCNRVPSGSPATFPASSSSSRRSGPTGSSSWRRGLAHFEDDEHVLDSPAEIGAYFADAQAFFKRAWEIHFEMMYPLLAAYVGFYGLCQQLGLDPGEISKFLQGEDSKIMEVDRQLWELTSAARRAGLTELFEATPAEDLLAAITASPHEHSQGLAAVLRRLPRDPRQPHRGDRRRRAAVVARGQHVAARDDQDVPPEARRPRLRAPPASSRVAERNEAIESARSKLSGDRTGTVRRGPRRRARRPTSPGGTRSTTTTSTCAPTSRCAGPRWPWPPSAGAATRPTGCSCSARSSTPSPAASGRGRRSPE